MNLPKQVQAAEERANEALGRMSSAEKQASNEAPAAPKQDQQQPPQAVTTEWEARYKALQGKYNAEVPRLSELVKSQQGQIEDTRREIEALKSKPPEADTPAKSADLTDEMQDKYDPEMIALIQQLSAKSAERAVDAIRPAVDKVVEKDKQRADYLLSEQRKSDLLDALNELVPEWQQVDASPAFAQYLQQIDPATGKHLQDTLNEAVQKFDAVKSARIFRGYVNSTPPPTAAPKKANLAFQQVPEIAGAGSSAPSGDKRVYTSAEAKEVMTRAALMSNRDPARAQAIEREIDLAMSEGRIR